MLIKIQSNLLYFRVLYLHHFSIVFLQFLYYYHLRMHKIMQYYQLQFIIPYWHHTLIIYSQYLYLLYIDILIAMQFYHIYPIIQYPPKTIHTSFLLYHIFRFCLHIINPFFYLCHFSLFFVIYLDLLSLLYNIQPTNFHLDNM